MYRTKEYHPKKLSSYLAQGDTYEKKEKLRKSVLLYCVPRVYSNSMTSSAERFTGKQLVVPCTKTGQAGYFGKPSYTPEVYQEKTSTSCRRIVLCCENDVVCEQTIFRSSPLTHAQPALLLDQKMLVSVENTCNI